ncbi:MAG: flagellar hook-basal body complex protein FliE [Oligoflexales bacterium]
MDKISNATRGLGSKLLAELPGLGEEVRGISNKQSQVSKGPSFLDHLKDAMNDVNQVQKDADAAAMDLATGKQEDIHETMLRAAHAELSFNLMVQVRNKVLEAYQEVMRMPV